MAGSDNTGELDYIRRPIPEAALVLPDGHRMPLELLVKHRAALLVLLPPASPSRAEALDRFAAWSSSLSLVDVIPVLPDVASPTPAPGVPDTVLYDPEGVGAELFGTTGEPTALLLGTDGLLAGGPVQGTLAIDEFIADVRSALGDRGLPLVASPLSISCKCITYGRVSLLEESLASFLAQQYEGRRELVIVNDYPLQRLHFDHPDVRIINVDFTFRTIGEKENFAVSACRYDTIAVWDDDDIALSNHLDNIRHFMPGHDLLHWQRGVFLQDGEVTGLTSLGNSGIVYSRRAWDAQGGHPHENAGYDMTFVVRLKEQGRPVSLAEPAPRQVSWFYRWGHGSYHMSGMGTDDGTRPHVIQRHADHIESLRVEGKIPTGDIELKPRWRRDYAAMLAEHCDRLGL